MNEERLQSETREARAGLPGKWMVAITMSLFLLVPAITYLSWKLTQGEPQRVSLDYSDRENWFMQPVTPRPLKYSTFVAAETGKTYKKTDLMLEPSVEQKLHQCARLAQDPAFAQNNKALDTLGRYASDPTNGFYPAYLLAEWHRMNANAALHAQWMQTAYERAGGALIQRLIDEEGNPVAGYRLPPVAIGYDRVIDGERDATLVLVYPAPVSDADGYVRLPTFRSVYRLTDAALPAGVDPGVHPIRLTLLPQEALGPEPNWFAVPDGAVGRFEDAVITAEMRVKAAAGQTNEQLR